MLSVAMNGYQHVASCVSNQVYQQHMDLSNQQTNPFLLLDFARKERNINSCSSNQDCLVRMGFTHRYLATSHKVTTTVTSAQHSADNQGEASHGASSPPSNGSCSDHWVLIQVLTPLVNQWCQLSVLIGHNIRVTHLATATHSSVSSRTLNRGDCVLGVPKPPSNGSKHVPLGAGATWLPL